MSGVAPTLWTEWTEAAEFSLLMPPAAPTGTLPDDIQGRGDVKKDIKSTAVLRE